MPPDYYKILDISCNASVDQIRQAFRNKAKLYHPDINRMPDAKILFQRINEAYQVLINADKRRWYDFKLKYPSTTGLRPQSKQRTTNHETYYRTYNQQQQQAKQEKKENTEYTRNKIDYFLFYFLVIAGFSAIIFSIIDLFDDEKKDKTYGGLVFGIWFLGIMFYGWNLLKKPLKNKQSHHPY